MNKKRRGKVKLPLDRSGIPIRVGDWLLFEDGAVHVETLTWMGDELGWYAGDGKEECAADNLSAGIVVCYDELTREVVE